MKTILKMVLAAGVASTLLAQDDEALRLRKTQERLAATYQQTFEFVSGQLVSGPPVKGAPYSAEAVNESIQTLADGNRIIQRTSSMQYRDTDGRERREETSAMGAIFITDPVSGARFTLHPENRTAEKGPVGNGVVYYSNGEAPGVPVGGRGQVTIAVGAAAAGGRGGEPARTIRLNGAPLALVTGEPKDGKTEQLGNLFIEGVQAQGTRTTTTIPAGDIGNDRPINIVDERWYSPDLKMTIMTKHSDPRSGETNFTLKNINRSNPPPTLFEVPSDYTVSAGGGGRGGRGVAVPVPAVGIK